VTERKTVLLVDDDEDILTTNQILLTAAGYDDIEVHEVIKKNWIAAMGKKTELPS